MSKSRLKSQRLDQTLGEFRSATKGTENTKTSTTLHTKVPGEGGSTVAGLLTPTDEQVARINQYTRSPKTADELVAFQTLSCNNLPDRDDDQFTDRTLDEFASAEAPFGPNGKSFMVGHNYETLPVGRIFGTGLAEEEGVRHLTNEVYIPNTQKNAGFIEDIDFGVNWAVSVGVMLEQVLCSACKAGGHEIPMYTFWGMSMCAEGHFKSAYYDPNSDETDEYGYPLERLPTDPGAVKTLGLMDGGKDFYELSQVFLGAQYFAALDTSSPVKSVHKSFDRSKRTFINLGASDAAVELPLQHVPDEVRRAVGRKSATVHEDGSYTWTDEESLVWRFSPGSEKTCLGRADTKSAEVEEDAGGTPSVDDDSDKEVQDDGQVDRSASDGSGEPLGSEDGVAEPFGDGAGDDDGGAEAPQQRGADEVQRGQDRVLTASAVRRSLAAAGLPEEWASSGLHGDRLLSAVLSKAATEIDDARSVARSLEPKAALGDKYIKGVRADAIDAYVKSTALAMGVARDHGVDTSTFEKVLDRCGDDVELIQALTEEHKSAARRLAPGKVLRSSVEPDPTVTRATDKTSTEPEPSSRGEQAVRRIHQ
jgi:hypothetical protein